MEVKSAPPDSILLRARRHGICAEFEKNLQERCGWQAGEGLLIGLSGGADSTALLLLAAVLAQRDKKTFLINAVYVHHHLRAEADGEVTHCANLCEQLGIAFSAVDVHPTRGRTGLAADARRLRHAALADCAVKTNSKWILLAHHSDDVLETLLMRIGRGAGNRGLTTIPWVRRSAPKSSIQVARPLLSLSRTQIEEFCRHCEVPWCDDASNSNIKTARGLLRDQIVPTLRERWPGIAQHALHASESARSGEWALKQIALMEGWTNSEIPRKLMKSRGPELSAALLASALRQRAISISLRMIRQVVEAACDRTVRPRIFHEEGVTISLNARILSISFCE